MARAQRRSRAVMERIGMRNSGEDFEHPGVPMGNPLRAHDRLSAACGIEYAAQAMAVHGALCAGLDGQQTPRNGLLASVRGVDLPNAVMEKLPA